MYVHTSYIDNSPNSVCEAQILGVPVICTNVGGVSSIVENNKTGYLVSSNDPSALASKILKLYKSEEERNHIGKAGKKIALIRHNHNSIISSLINTYNDIISH